ncbi:NADAR family protein [Serratia fonticola]|uniref:NADAR family protein n=1 Tax=Serratia fonticola TaxID=47917 RepID=UPI003AAE0F32
MQQGNYTLDALQKSIRTGKRFKYLYFWGHRPSPSGAVTASCFSQWWPSPFKVDDVTYASAEHWMMAGKARLFSDEAILPRILNAKSPAEAKKFGREVSDFNQQMWEAHCFELVCEGNLHKFSQHPQLGAFLVGTRSRVLVEASPVDRVWGIGLAQDDERAANPLRWNGTNLLGFALMVVRDTLGGTNRE